MNHRTDESKEMKITFSTKSGGRPENHDLIPWEKSDTKYLYTTCNNGRAYRWTGIINAVHIPFEKGEFQWDGSLLYTKYRLRDGTVFYYGYHEGDSYRFDRAAIRMTALE